ncbi:MAG TPA: hypothetical protein VHN98_08900 [Acidimicrobiales bacterium]|nr:hypothetical protein [Acidimicrobiales bacterium]
MSNLLYLGIAVVVSILGALWIWARNRKPTSLEHGIEEFQRELRALSNDRRPVHPPRSDPKARRGTPPGQG